MLFEGGGGADERRGTLKNVDEEEERLTTPYTGHVLAVGTPR